MNKTYLRALTLLLVTAIALPLAAQESPNAPEWDKDAVDLFATLPVQDGGRVKPLDTLAQFTLLALNGARTYRDADGVRRTHLEWLLDCMFYPEIAKNYRHFVVSTSEAITAIGITSHEKKRDRYSYNEIQSGIGKLFNLAHTYQDKDAQSRGIVEQQIIDLAHNVHRFEQLTAFLDCVRAQFTAPEGSRLAAALSSPQGAGASEIVIALDQVAQELQEKKAELGEASFNSEMESMRKVYMEQLLPALASADFARIFPNPDPANKEWLTPGELPHIALDLDEPSAGALQLLAGLEDLAQNRVARLTAEAQNAAKLDAEFMGSLRDLHQRTVAQAEARGEYAKVPLEVLFYRGKFLFYSQWLFVLSFILVAVSWLLPQRRLAGVAAHLSVIAPTILLVIAITLRCIIRGRPPVTTLYETILFVTAVVVMVSMAIEWMNRRGIALAMASFLGMLGMFIAYRYEIKEGVDTMPSLIAVLDTNFWLSTHVTTVTMGYGAGLLSGALAHLYIIGRLFGIRKNDAEFYKGLTRMVYGVLCFGLLFACVGTVLGGIWANDSWGRFWGWDPKENGALLIVLWGLLLLHARLGGYISELGIHMGSVTLGMIVAFSWWGVNLLGVGLHSYGFTSGVGLMLKIFWGIEGVVLVLGALVYFKEQFVIERKTAPREPAKNTRTA